MHKFEPDWALAPGVILQELLAGRELTIVKFAAAAGLTPSQVSRILDGDYPITEDVADRLGQALGVAPSFWLNLESMYREHLARNPGSVA